MADYFISTDGQRQEGPFAVRELLDRGLRPDSLVWREGMPEWQRADTVAELAAIFARPTPPPPPPPAGYATNYSPPQFHGPPSIGYGGPIPYDRSDVNGKRVAAGVCGILFGGLGIHKFILGFAGTGLLMLLTCIFTCGVMHIIGFIEGIIYLTKTDEDFYQTYIVERRNWF
jgi:TM2 domain-containing membrane protein YozV